MKTLKAVTGVIVIVATLSAAAEGTGKVVTIGTEVTGHSVPWRGSGASMRFQCLWRQSDIGYAGYINAVEFRYSSGSSSGTFDNCRVLLCHTTKEELDYIFAENYAGRTPVTVLDVPKLALSGTEWIDIGINAETFNYNNNDNLLMEILWRGDSNNNIYCKIYTDRGNRCYAFNDNAGSGSVYGEGQYIRLHIGTMVSVEPTSLGRVKALYQ